MLDQLRGAGISIQDEDEDTKAVEVASKTKQLENTSTFVWGRNQHGELSSGATQEFTIDPLPLSLSGESGTL